MRGKVFIQYWLAIYIVHKIFRCRRNEGKCEDDDEAQEGYVEKIKVEPDD